MAKKRGGTYREVGGQLQRLDRNTGAWHPVDDDGNDLQLMPVDDDGNELPPVSVEDEEE